MTSLGDTASGAGQRQHLLLAPREAAGALGAPLPEDGETLDRTVDGGAPVLTSLLGDRHAQIVVDRQTREDAAPFGDVGQPELSNAVRGQTGHVTAVETHTTRDRPHQSRDRARQGALARTVRTEHGEHGPSRHGQRHSEESLRRAVADVEVLHLEDRSSLTIPSALPGAVAPG